MAHGRPGEREATFKVIEEVHDCPAVWDASSGAYNDTKNKEKLKFVAKGGISTDIGFHPNPFLFLLRRITLKRPRHKWNFT